MSEALNTAQPQDAVPNCPILQIAGHYRLRLAASESDLTAIFALRFRVFNIELDEGLAESYATGEDRDAYDEQCDHLIVEDLSNGDIIGTYRMQDQKKADAGIGFYSSSEFDLSGLGSNILGQSVELGRACIDEAHRNTRVLFLLWRGLATYMVSRGHRYFFGCCSLTSQEPAEGIALHRRLVKEGSCSDTLSVDVQPVYRCTSDETSIASFSPRVPKLMRLYLSYGAMVVSDPAIDQAFSTIDFLALFDLESLDEQARRMFLDE